MTSNDTSVAPDADTAAVARQLAQLAKRGAIMPADSPLLAAAERLGVDVPEGIRPRASRDQGDARTLELVDAADVEVRGIDWLWEQHVPRGMETIAFGPGGVGKSTAFVELAARVTRGLPLPGDGGEREPAGVLYVGAEDAADRVVKPRLENAGADLSRGRFGFLGRVRDGDGQLVPLRLPQDVDALGELIEGRGVALLIVDPITAYLGGDVDTHRVTDLRDALLPLQDMIDRTNVATLLIAHPNKDERQASIARLSGSHAWVVTARSVLGYAPRQDGGAGALVKLLKANVAADVPAHAFQLEPGEPHPGLMVARWGERVAIARDDLLRKPDRRRDSPQLEQAMKLLSELLEEAGGVLDAKDAAEEMKLAGIDKTTMARARDRLGVTTTRIRDDGGRTRGWVWYRELGTSWTRLLRLAAEDDDDVTERAGS